MADREQRPAGPFLASPLPPWFHRRVVVLDPGEQIPYVDDEWRDSIVVIEQGEVELECTQGGRRSFARGDVLWMVGLSLRTIHSCGRAPAVLVSVSRR